MAINFNTDKLVIFYYPAGAGGKFLINTIGLSNKAVFQDAELAKKQLTLSFNQLEKTELLLERLGSMSGEWDDVGLGCHVLFDRGLDFIKFYSKNIPINDEIRNIVQFNSVIDDLTNSDKYFFIVANSCHALSRLLFFWPNAKVVEFYNNEKFLETRFSSKKHSYKWFTFKRVLEYHTLKGNEWPDNYPTIDTYLKLPDNIQKDIDNYYDFFNIKEHKDIKKHIIYKWDTSDYFHFDKTYNSLEKLLKILDIDDIEENNVYMYYNKWISSIL